MLEPSVQGEMKVFETPGNPIAKSSGRQRRKPFVSRPQNFRCLVVRECNLPFIVKNGDAVSKVSEDFREIGSVRHGVMQYKVAIRISQFECAILLDFR